MNSIPTFGRSGLPVNLSTIMQDPRSHPADLAQVDSEFALSSVMWLVKDGMFSIRSGQESSGTISMSITFPFRYRDMERLNGLSESRVRQYAATHGLPFIDVAGRMPFDSNLFADAVHTTYPGARLKAWVVLQQLVPIIEKRLASGAWPKPVPVMGACIRRLRRSRGRCRSTASRDEEGGRRRS